MSSKPAEALLGPSSLPSPTCSWPQLSIRVTQQNIPGAFQSDADSQSPSETDAHLVSEEAQVETS